MERSNLPELKDLVSSSSDIMLLVDVFCCAHFSMMRARALFNP